MTSLRLLAGAALACAVLAPAAAVVPERRSGAHDFDWEIGTWTTKVRVRRNPLTGEPAQWAEYSGRSVVKPLLDGRANFVELSVTGASGKIEGGSLRLYGSQTAQWSLNYTNLRNGLLTSPVYGGFDANGRGLFYGRTRSMGERSSSVSSSPWFHSTKRGSSRPIPRTAESPGKTIGSRWTQDTSVDHSAGT